MYNMGSRSVIMIYVIIKSMSLLNSKKSVYLRESSWWYYPFKKSDIKNFKSLFLAIKFSNEQYFWSFYLVLVIQEIIGNGWKRNLCKNCHLYFWMYIQLEGS